VRITEGRPSPGTTARDSPEDPEPLLREGDTCWRVAEAERVAFLIDGENYFGAVAEALEQARERVFLLGWDFHTDMRLRRGEGEVELVRYLDALVRRRRGLHVYVLEWDFAMLFAAERQVLPTFRFGTRTHRRLHFALDGNHPPTGSHHEKLVVVDDVVAFTGGLDVTVCRWDSREHRGEDPRRSDPGFPDYGPFHDIGVALEGPVARSLGELARKRWAQATGKRVPLARSGSSPWPADLAAPLEKVAVGLARTRPAWEGEPACREVEALYLESIRRARHTIYVENQYLTSAAVGDALAERLREREGPEVFLILPEQESGWLESATLGVLRDRLLRRLREADLHDRLVVTHPVLPSGERLNVHSKLMIIDDELVRLGSSNLANRSMGLDSELDVAIEAHGEARIRGAITALRDDLLAEHLGSRPEEVRRARDRSGSLRATLEALGAGPRTLCPLEPNPEQPLAEWLPEPRVIDPEQPIGFEQLSAALLPDAMQDPTERRPLLRAAAALAALFALASLWRWTPLSELLVPADLVAFAQPLRAHALGAPLAAAAMAVAGTLMIPITALILACALLFGPWLGFVVALSGALLSALLSYGVGRLLWRDALHRLMTSRVRRLSRYVAARGLFAIATVRVVPVAPFGVVNLAAGASHVGLRDYTLGTLLGMAPGTLAMSLLGDRMRLAVIDPGWTSALTLLAVIGAVLVAGVFAHRRLGRRAEGGPNAAKGS
jgi:phosphatidylserine/phosphatidylglycerophosphate/cardiolipin synthase-like enzyme/uncharacterized membrane protein YdjX (TVP38/TMEM64 family)